jgi:hypothetical protein
VQLKVVVPTGKAAPETGLHETVAPSDALTEKFTVAEHWPGSVTVTRSAGHVIVGGSPVALIVTLPGDNIIGSTRLAWAFARITFASVRSTTPSGALDEMENGMFTNTPFPSAALLSE